MDQAAADLARLSPFTVDVLLRLQREPGRVAKLRAGVELARKV